MSPEYKVGIRVDKKEGILNPEASAVLNVLHQLRYDTVTDMSISRLFTLVVNAPTPKEARTIAKETANKLLANPVLETFRVVSVKPNKK